MTGKSNNSKSTEGEKHTRSKGGVSALLSVQRQQFQSLGRLCISAEKLKNTSALASVNFKLKALLEIYAKCNATHLELAGETEYTEDVETYLDQDEFGLIETRYLDIVDYLTELQDELSTAAANVPPAPTSSGEPTAPAAPRFHGLDRITLPTFNGDQRDWPQFKDMFEAMILRESSLSKVQKFYYLKNSLSGSALSLVKNITLTNDNFDDAWKIIKDHYEDVRLITFSLITRLLKLEPVGGDSAAALEELIVQTREIMVSLKNVGQFNSDALLVVMTLLRLDPEVRKSFEEKVGTRNKFPKYEDLELFLNSRVHALNVAAVTPGISSASDTSFSESSKTKGSETKVSTHVSTTTASSCVICSEFHSIASCPKFRALSSSTRLETIRSQRLCYNCLNKGHIPPTCKRRSACDKCTRRHHTLLHDALDQSFGFSASNSTSNNFGDSSTSSSPQVNTVTSNHSGTVSSGNSKSALIATAWIRVRTACGNEAAFRAIIDSGSECSLISEKAAQILRAQRIHRPVSVTGIGATVSGIVKHATRLDLYSRTSYEAPLQIEALILPKLSSYAPRRYIKVSEWPNLNLLTLADPDPCGKQTIDILLGMDCYDRVLGRDRLKFPGEPLAVQSRFGWVLRGPVEDVSADSPAPESVASLHITRNDELSRSVERFWKIEEVPNQLHLTAEEKRCEKQFVETTTRDATGRYTVALPFTETPPLDIGNSLELANVMFNRLERRLAKNSELAVAYDAFLAEYLRLGHMSYCSTPAANEPHYFIPHHPVIKPSSSSTKVRVVFNASAPSSTGKSLNDFLLVGPKLQQDLPAIVLRWRLHRFVGSADVEKMFRQIRVRDEDSKYQLIRYRCPTTCRIITCKLDTVTYGTASAPYLAQRVLRQLAEDEKDSYPLAAPIIIENTFVDDAFFGAQTLDECREIRNQILKLFASGGFHLHKWSSNNQELLSDLPIELLEPTHKVPLQEDSQVKILGICWNPHLDVFEFNVHADSSSVRTKRAFLSFLAQIYDPLGWLSPIIVVGKILLQKTWMADITWDEEFSTELHRETHTFCSELPALCALKIPRWLSTLNGSTVELHGFSDASQKAYAAVVYLRVNCEGTAKTFLLTAKSKVAPLKTLSIPRLELCAAELLSRLLDWVTRSLHLDCVPTFAWTDSTIVLHWLKSSPSNWRIFVANRVAKIQTLCPNVAWRHVPTADNPADLASRGLQPSQIIHNLLWWEGPEWLGKNPQFWPSQHCHEIEPSLDIEVRATTTHVTNVLEWEFPLRFSDWGKLIRVTALLLRVIRRRLTEKGPELDVSLMKDAKFFWISYIQKILFSVELDLLSKGQRLPRSSPLKNLNPYLDSMGIIRMRSRLENAPLTFAQKCPAIIGDSPLTRLIVRHAHLRSLHGGTGLTGRLLREELWLIRARVIIKGVLSRCVICTRHRATTREQQMAPLPKCRVTGERAFLKTGIDYAGPIAVRAFAGRGHQSRKGYIAIFVCMVTRAIHIELVGELTTVAFIAAFRRFVSRRGIPIAVYSDNGTNFQGGQAELIRLFRAALNDPVVAAHMSSIQIEWHFIPPSSPHFGGMWEAGVKSIKYHLRRIVGTHTLTVAELETLLCQIEACLNSRPIAGFSSENDDLSYLTPGHFLIGAPLLALPEPSMLSRAENSLTRYQSVQLMRDRFWKVWRLDYLNTLQKRTKWRDERPNLRVDDIVLVKEDNTPASHWVLGRIVRCFAGQDDLVRVCEVKTASKIMRRPACKLCLLPVRDTE